jgi:hypothetical protein
MTLFMLAVIYYENIDKYLIKKGAPFGTPINASKYNLHVIF